MPQVSKRRKAFAKKVDHAKSYAALDAMKLVKETATAKFDEAVDVAVNLGIDAKKGDQTVRGSVVLPSGTGKTVRVAVFAPGDKGVGRRDVGDVRALGAHRYRITSTSAPPSRPVAGSGTTTYPSARVRTDSRADGPNTGSATPSCTRTWTTSSRPAAEARLRDSRARVDGSGGTDVQPATDQTSGMPTRRNTTSADSGFPGSPTTGTPRHSASRVGLPGRNASP